MTQREFHEREISENFKRYVNGTYWGFFLLRVLRKENLNGKFILDVGAGWGFILRNLIREGVVPYAIEFSDPCISYLKRKGINVKKIDISIEYFPYENHTFDYIIFSEVIEHLIFPQHALKEIHRVLKPDGKLLISTHNAFNLYMRLRYLIGAMPSPDLDVSNEGGHVRLFNRTVLIKLLRRAGFQTIIDRSWFKFGSIEFFVPPFCSSWLARHFLLICSKRTKF
jgi:2-polyprenyl-3-methyl-5-hydroxy-6-metoxy-1,4-benzoquinol methylase